MNFLISTNDHVKNQTHDYHNMQHQYLIDLMNEPFDIHDLLMIKLMEKVHRLFLYYKIEYLTLILTNVDIIL